MCSLNKQADRKKERGRERQRQRKRKGLESVKTCCDKSKFLKGVTDDHVCVKNFNVPR